MTVGVGVLFWLPMPEVINPCAHPDVAPGDRIGIVMYGYGLANSPSLINLARHLADAGFAIDFFTCGTFLGDIDFGRNDIRVFSDSASSGPMPRFLLPAAQCLDRAICRGFNRLKSSSERVDREVQTLTGKVTAFANRLFETTRGNRYRCFVGVEPLGLLAASILAQSHGNACIYYNMELHLDSDGQTRAAALKFIEHQYNRRVRLTITQDEVRKRLLVEQNGLAAETVLLLPVCADGEPFTARTSTLPEMLGLNPGQRIVLYAGFLADWAMCEELAIASRAWPAEWVLVFHGHGYHDAAYLRRLNKHASERVRFSLQPVPYEKLSSLLASADVGVALYRDLGENFTQIGAASGKIAHYLKSGLPVIVNDYPSIAEVIENYGCGCAVAAPSLVGDALRRILSDHERMRTAAFKCYREHYMLSNYVRPVLERIVHL